MQKHQLERSLNLIDCIDAEKAARPTLVELETD